MFFYEIKSKEYPWGLHQYAYAEIWKEGKMLASGSNCGRDKHACMVECASLYNRQMFNDGLRPII